MGRPKAVLDLDGAELATRPVAALRAGGAEVVALVGGDRAWATRLGLHAVADRWPGEGPLGGLASAVSAAVGLSSGGAEEGDKHGGAGGADEAGDDDEAGVGDEHGEHAGSGEASTSDGGAGGGDDPDRPSLMIVVAACDQPDLTGELVASLVQALRAAPPSVEAAAPITPDGRRHPFPSAWRVTAADALVALVDGGARRAADAFSVANPIDVPTGHGALADLDTPADVASWRRRRSP
jgi:molybdopterin-guanine dinucleotide biosynthesis protein A